MSGSQGPSKRGGCGLGFMANVGLSTFQALQASFSDSMMDVYLDSRGLRFKICVVIIFMPWPRIHTAGLEQSHLGSPDAQNVQIHCSLWN